jgi:hypothetical protein
MPLIFPGGLIGGAPPIQAVALDGNNDDLIRSSAMSGVSAGAFGSMSFWLKVNTNGANLSFIAMESGVADSFASRGVTNKLTIIWRSGSAARINMTSSSDILIASGWVHVLASWNAGASDYQLYLDDVSDLASGSNPAGNINYTAGTIRIGTGPGSTSDFNGALAEFWLSTTEQIDFSVTANRRKFIKADGSPAYLGPDGSLPTGNQPAIYINQPAATWGTNAGFGGNFTIINDLKN